MHHVFAQTTKLRFSDFRTIIAHKKYSILLRPKAHNVIDSMPFKKLQNLLSSRFSNLSFQANELYVFKEKDVKTF